MLRPDSDQEGVQNKSSITKLNPPRVQGIYTRTRLFDWLDAARKTHPVIWINAPGGAGKTTLIASYLHTRGIRPLWYVIDETDEDLASFFYHLGWAAPRTSSAKLPLPALTPDYLAGLPAFTRNFFRNLFGRMRKTGAVVLDNFQELADSATLHDCLPAAFNEIPPDLNAIVISRSAPPLQYSRLLANNHIAQLDWQALQLTEEEALGFAKARKQDIPDLETTIPLLLRETQGWAAGLALLLEQSSAAIPSAFSLRNQDLARIFDYFVSEVFRNTEPNTQSFLLWTAFLPFITSEIAEKLTNNKAARRLLEDLTRRNYFTVRHTDGSYEYHPLFRRFLQNRAEDVYEPALIQKIHKNCASVLLKSGQTDLAIVALVQTGDWNAAIPLILEHAPIMMAQGRIQTLGAWLLAVPQALREQNPWILYWLGNSRMPFHQQESRSYFEKAFYLFDQKDSAGPLYLAWAGIANSVFMEQGDYTPIAKWLEAYSTIEKKSKPADSETEAASFICFLTAMLSFHPNTPHITHYIKKLDSLSLKTLEPFIVQIATLAAALIGFGEVERSKRLIEGLKGHIQSSKTAPILMTIHCSASSLFSLLTWSPQECIQQAITGITLAEKQGITSTELLASTTIAGHLLLSNVKAARESANYFLEKTKNPNAGNGYFLYCIACIALHENNLKRAIQEIQYCLNMANKSGMVPAKIHLKICLSVAYGKAGDIGRALEAMQNAYIDCSDIPMPAMRNHCILAEANIRYWCGENDKAAKAFKVWLHEASSGNALAFPPWQLPQEAAALFNMALEADIQCEFICDVIQRIKLAAPTTGACDRWPFPVKIYLLGRQSVLINGSPQIISTKSAARPFDMLRCLIALGGRQIHHQQLIAALWPDSEGDAAVSTFHATLHRLRKLLGVEDALTLKDGYVCLESSRVWVDTWSLERALTQLDSACQRAAPENEVDRLTDSVMRLYKGPFVVPDGGDLPSLAYRERLQRRMLYTLARTGTYYEDRIERYIAVHERMLDIDPNYEPAYQALMQAYSRNGRLSEAAATYVRCRSILSRTLGVMPSERTVAIYNRIVTQNTPLI